MKKLVIIAGTIILALGIFALLLVGDDSLRAKTGDVIKESYDSIQVEDI